MLFPCGGGIQSGVHPLIFPEKIRKYEMFLVSMKESVIKDIPRVWYWFRVLR